MRRNPNLKKGVKLNVPHGVNSNNNDAKGCALIGGLGTVVIVCGIIALIGLIIVVIKFVVPLIVLLFILLTHGKIGG